MTLVMVVKAFVLLVPVSLQKCRIQIRKNVFRRPDPVDLLEQDTEDFLELNQGILVQTVEKPRHRRLGSKGILAKNCAEHRICGKVIYTVIIEVSGNNLKESLHQALFSSTEAE